MSNLFDSANYPTREPDSLVVGDRWLWKRSDLNADYSNSLYTLKYSLRLEGSGDKEIEITAAASGSDFLIEVDAATTAAYAAGRYRWQSYIIRDSDSERLTLESGTFEVQSNRDADTGDPRTHVRKVLNAIEAVLEGTATKEQESYSISGRALSLRSIPDLLLLRDRYRTEARNEEIAERVGKGLGDPRRLGVRLNRV